MENEAKVAKKAPKKKEVKVEKKAIKKVALKANEEIFRVGAELEIEGVKFIVKDIKGIDMIFSRKDYK